MTSPPTGILPPIPIGQSQASRAPTKTARTAADASNRDQLAPTIAEIDLASFAPSGPDFSGSARCTQILTSRRVPERRQTRSTQGNSFKAAIDFTRSNRTIGRSRSTVTIASIGSTRA